MFIKTSDKKNKINTNFFNIFFCLECCKHKKTYLQINKLCSIESDSNIFELRSSFNLNDDLLTNVEYFNIHKMIVRKNNNIFIFVPKLLFT